MPYSIKEGSCQTADGIGGQYAVIKDDDGQQMGCHQTREAALDQIAALEASEEMKVLPESYRPSMDDAVNCGTCKHYAHSYCHLWQDNVMNDYVCDAYAPAEEDHDDEAEVTIEIEVKRKEVAPQDVRAAYRRGLELYEEGFGGRTGTIDHSRCTGYITRRSHRRRTDSQGLSLLGAQRTLLGLRCRIASRRGGVAMGRQTGHGVVPQAVCRTGKAGVEAVDGCRPAGTAKQG